MKLQLSTLKRIIKEEVQRLNESTREFTNLRSDALNLGVNDFINLEIHTDTGVKQATLMCTGELDPSLYDYDDSDSPVKQFKLTVTKKVLARGTIDKITSWFKNRGFEFSY